MTNNENPKPRVSNYSPKKEDTIKTPTVESNTNRQETKTLETDRTNKQDEEVEKHSHPSKEPSATPYTYPSEATDVLDYIEVIVREFHRIERITDRLPKDIQANFRVSTLKKEETRVRDSALQSRSADSN